MSADAPSSTDPPLGEPFGIEVSGDALTAALILAEGATADVAAVAAKLRELGVARFDEKSIGAILSGAGGKACRHVVAIGTAPVDERRESFAVDLLSSADDLPKLVKVESGQVVSIPTPRAAGKTGKNVFGEPIPFRKLTDQIRLGRNIAMRVGKACATAAGSLRLKDGTLSVEPLTEITIADDASKDVAVDGDISAQTSLRDGRRIHAKGTVWVDGAIEASDIEAAESAIITGGIAARDKGSVTVGGELSCKFISAAKITAGGDVTVDGEASHSRVVCAGRFVAARGPVFGGEISAAGGVNCPILGSPNGSATVIQAGGDDQFLATIQKKAESFDKNRRHIRDVRGKLEPLLRDPKRLTKAQRERATELLYEAGELEERTNKEIAELAEHYRRSQSLSRCEITVADSILPGVTIRFPGVEAVITSPLKGPLKLTRRGEGQGAEIVVVDGASGKSYPLESRSIPDPAAELTECLFGKPAARSPLRAKCISAFVAATQELFQTMVRVPLTLAKPRIKTPGERIFKLYRISAAIQLSGTVTGCVWISFSEKVAITIAAALSGETYTALTRDCRDALSEIANMIVGAAKRQISDKPVVVSVPVLQNTENLAYLPGMPTILIPFDTAAGRFIIEVAIADAPVAQMAA